MWPQGRRRRVTEGGSQSHVGCPVLRKRGCKRRSTERWALGGRPRRKEEGGRRRRPPRPSPVSVGSGQSLIFECLSTCPLALGFPLWGTLIGPVALGWPLAPRPPGAPLTVGASGEPVSGSGGLAGRRECVPAPHHPNGVYVLKRESPSSQTDLTSVGFRAVAGAGAGLHGGPGGPASRCPGPRAVSSHAGHPGPTCAASRAPCRRRRGSSKARSQDTLLPPPVPSDRLLWREAAARSRGAAGRRPEACRPQPASTATRVREPTQRRVLLPPSSLQMTAAVADRLTTTSRETSSRKHPDELLASS